MHAWNVKVCSGCGGRRAGDFYITRPFARGGVSDVYLFPFQPIRGCCAGGAIAAARAVLLRMAPSLGFYLLVKEAEHAGARPLLQGEAYLTISKHNVCRIMPDYILNHLRAHAWQISVGLKFVQFTALGIWGFKVGMAGALYMCLIAHLFLTSVFANSNGF